MNMRNLNKWLQYVLLSLVLALALPGSPAARAQKSSTHTTAPAAGQKESLAPAVVAAPRVAASVSPTVFYYHPDATGNLMALSDENAQVVWRADMRPFGQGTATSADHPLRFLDKPRERDIGIRDGLYHLGARVYDPLTGRFLSPDPLSLAAVELENPQRFNRYAYGLNNPYRYMDPSGRLPVDVLERIVQTLTSVVSGGLGGAIPEGFGEGDEAPTEVDTEPDFDWHEAPTDVDIQSPWKPVRGARGGGTWEEPTEVNTKMAPLPPQVTATLTMELLLIAIMILLLPVGV